MTGNEMAIESGYYWVLFSWGWEPARWDGDEWLRFGIEQGWNYDVREIGPRIEKPESIT
jgi:hypothetical protein